MVDAFRENLLARLTVTPSEADAIATAEQHLPSGEANPVWLDARKGRMTGSAVGALCGLSPYETPDKILQRLLGLSTFTSNPCTRWGNANEHCAQDSTWEFLVAQHGEAAAPIENPGLMVSPERGWAAMSPDGLWDAPDGTSYLLEYKVCAAPAFPVFPAFPAAR